MSLSLSSFLASPLHFVLSHYFYFVKNHFSFIPLQPSPKSNCTHCLHGGSTVGEHSPPHRTITNEKTFFFSPIYSTTKLQSCNFVSSSFSIICHPVYIRACVSVQPVIYFFCQPPPPPPKKKVDDSVVGFLRGTDEERGQLWGTTRAVSGAERKMWEIRSS